MYPFVLLFRNENDFIIDLILNKTKLQFSLVKTENHEDLNKLFDPNYLLLTIGVDYSSLIYRILPEHFSSKWIHFNTMPDINTLNQTVMSTYMNIVVNCKRPTFSIFTTCYNSYDKILRAYDSIKSQTLKDWEWVILDDSPDGAHFKFLTKIKDKRIRLYKRSENSGNIGNVKNEAVMLCRGKYVLEMDHDDEILPDCLLDAESVFETYSDVGFVYMDFANINENGSNFSYGDFFGLGYAGYYCQKYKNKWINVASHPNINNVTLSDIVSVPNHPRMWRKSVLIDIGNYSEFLPVADDYELFLRTAVHTKMARISKLGYIQYMNSDNNNFSLIRNSEITRLRKLLYEKCYVEYKITEKMKSMDAYEDESFITKHSQIWKRKNYEYKFCNQIINANYKKQYCILGLDVLRQQKDTIRQLYDTNENDFLVLDSKHSIDVLSKELELLNFDKMKCYVLKDHSDEELINYFHLVYKSCEDVEIITHSKIPTISNTKTKVTIITPCSRPENIIKLKESINFEYVNEWIIVHDKPRHFSLSDVYKNDKIKEYVHEGGTSGNPQRNFALDMINYETYIYFLDDDNIIHYDLYELLNIIEPGYMYTFNQSRTEDVFPYTSSLKGDNLETGNIDTAMLLIDFKLCKEIRWIHEKYDADGYYIKECYESNKDKWIYVDNTLCYYNKLT